MAADPQALSSTHPSSSMLTKSITSGRLMPSSEQPDEPGRTRDQPAIFVTPLAAQLYDGVTEVRIHVTVHPQTLELEFPPYIAALESVLSREQYDAWVADARARTAPHRFKPERMAWATCLTCCCCIGCPCYLYYSRQIVKGFEKFAASTTENATGWTSARPAAIRSEKAQPQSDAPDYRGYDEHGVPYRMAVLKPQPGSNEIVLETVTAWPPSGVNIVLYAQGRAVYEGWPKQAVPPTTTVIRRV